MVRSLSITSLIEYYKTHTLAQAFSKVNPNALARYFMEDYEETLRYQHILPVVREKPRFHCEREMIRDFDKEVRMGDGYAYWISTGKLLVTWHDGSTTRIETYPPKHSPVVSDCGYDESVPF